MTFKTQFDMNSDSLNTQTIRAFIGQRTIDLFALWTSNNRGMTKRQMFQGFASSAAFMFLDWVVSQAGNYLIASLMTLYTFNWNQTDKEIEDQIKALDLAVYNQAGQLAANGLIYFAGIGLTNQAAKRYPVVSGKALLEAAEEGGEEVRNSIRSFFMVSRNALASYTLLTTYLTARKMISGAQVERREPWMISDQLDKMVDSNKSPQMKSFWTGFKDQAEDAVLDLLMIINMGIVSQWELHKQARKASLGKERLVKVTFDEQAETQSAWLYGAENVLMSQVSNLLAEQQLIETKDIGNIIQASPDTAISADPSRRSIEIEYYETENGASTLPDGSRAETTSIAIKDLKITTWQDWKTVCTPYTKGNFLVSANLRNKRKLSVYAQSEAEGKSVLNKFLPLQTSDLIRWTVSEIDPVNPLYKKSVKRMYAKYAKFRILKPTSDPNKIGWMDKRENQGYEVITFKFKINVENEPENLPPFV